ncbi:hypothetical protein J6590_086644 [Homalodisca vitripennis]|nr:hypothetical protein J6590_086644 [Homalodisca vitripennis]
MPVSHRKCYIRPKEFKGVEGQLGVQEYPQVAEGTTITNVLVTSKGTVRRPTLPAVENEIKCADITGNLETKPVNVPNLVSTPSKPRKKAGDQREVISQ